MLRRAKLNLSPLLRRPVARFVRDEDGTLLMFGLYLFVLMVMLGGLAVDLMRYEQRRTALQQTIDRSVLAATSLTQDIDPEIVVNDWFEKAELKQYLRDVEVTEGLNFRNVHATADALLDPFFTHMVGIDEFFVPAASEAEQTITDVEIVLVLDVSGSMTEATGSSTKIVELRKAAAKFVETVKARDTQNRISIAIVPYNAQVNLGEVLRSKFNATHLNEVKDGTGTTIANCLEIPAANFNIATLPRTLALPMAAYADTVSNTSQSTSFVSPTSTNSSSGATHVANTPFCRTTAANIVRLPNGDVDTLKAQINGLQAAGNTSTALGVRWGLMLLDPAMRPMFAELADARHMPEEFADRPFDWDTDPDTEDNEKLKVMVVMTDGDHVAHNRITDAYKTGTSPIFRSSGDGNYSIRHTSGRPAAAGTNEYWVPHRNSGAGEWRSAPWNSGAGVTQMDWRQIWERQRVTWVAWQLYARALGTSSSTRTSIYNSTLNAMRQAYASDAQLDTRMSQTCKLARDRDVVVYGIAFEAPAQGQAAIADCTTRKEGTTPELSGFYFNATDAAGIHQAFSAIAANISQLRLTQ